MGEEAPQRTRIIAVACNKGGVAKTTTTMQIAASLAKRGENVVVLDADQTGGATNWEETVHETNQQRKEEADEKTRETGRPHHYRSDDLGFEVIPANQASLNRKRIIEKYPGRWILIDTPPSDMGTIQMAINAADVTIIPTQPGQADLVKAGETYAAADSAVILLTRVKRNTIAAREALSEIDGMNAARFEQVISERESIRNLVGTTKTDTLEYPAVTNELVELVHQIEDDEQEDD